MTGKKRMLLQMKMAEKLYFISCRFWYLAKCVFFVSLTLLSNFKTATVMPYVTFFTFPTISRSRSARSDAFDSADPEEEERISRRRKSKMASARLQSGGNRGKGERSSIDGGSGGTRARAESADFRLRINGLYLLNRLEENKLRPL